MIDVYGIKNCNTMKKALNWLDSQGLDYQFHDFKKEGVDEATLKQWETKVSWEQLINKKGLTWRGLTDEEKLAVKDATSANALMKQKTSLIKRPVIAKGGELLTLGFDEEIYQAKLL